MTGTDQQVAAAAKIKADVDALMALIPPPAPAPPATRKLRLAVCGVAQRTYVPGLVQRFKDAGISWDRDDVGDGTDLSRVQQNLARGFKSIVLYNPPSGLAPATYAAQVKSLASRILPLGLIEIEFVNEPWLNGWAPDAYAHAYAAAHDAVKGMGITLIASATGDYITLGGTWSSDAGGKGWIHDVLMAMPAGVVDAWSCHPYGPMSGTGTDDSGWASVANHRSNAVKYGSLAPWYITEVGQRVSDVGLAGQAAAVTQYLNDVRDRYPYVVFWSWYEVIDDSSGSWGMVELDGTPRPAFTALQAWTAANKALLS